jgi:AcrR family transcriptional regulator
MRGRPTSIREEEILDAARDVFREEGHAATTAQIAKRARVSQGILFYRYKSKEALLAAVIRRETQPPELLREIVTTAGKRSVAENLERIAEALIDGVAHAHPFIELAMMSPASGEIHKMLFSKATPAPPQQNVELVRQYFAAEIQLGRVRPISDVSAARAIFGACIDYVRSAQATQDRAGRTAFVQGLVDIITHGTVTTTRSKRQG